MNFEVLYVEDVDDDWLLLKGAVRERNKTAKSPKIVLKRVRDPERLRNELSLNTRLVLADMVFPDPSSPAGERPKLGDVILSVQAWTNEQRYGSPLPIIAFTGRGEASLKLCLTFKDSLYDIWDKSSASAEYVAWRLSEISRELWNNRPDALSQRLIREMSGDTLPTWHDSVVDMTRGYDAGWSEQDQINRAGESIADIAVHLNVWSVCGPLWETMVKWEPLSRAVDAKTRGHARHVINVFWLGYYLLHHPHLAKLFTKYWKILVNNRRNMGAVANHKEPLKALSNCWFFASLFHDVGGCVERVADVDSFQNDLIKIFGDLGPTGTDRRYPNPDEFLRRAKAWLGDFDEPLYSMVETTLQASVENRRPDQGVVGALYLREMIENPETKCYAVEAGRAMSLHNMFPKLAHGKGGVPVSWDKEPLVCLLLLCDQLQTWDRERGTESVIDTDKPVRAELSDLSIEQDTNRPQIKMFINYLARKHLGDSKESYERTKTELKNILLKNPYSALNRITKPWPFTLELICMLNGDPLPPMKFGG